MSLTIENLNVHEAVINPNHDIVTISQAISDKSTVLLIDSSHMYHITKALRLNLDYNKLNNLIRNHFTVIRNIFYVNTANRDNNKMIPVIDFLGYNNFEVNVDYFEFSEENSTNVKPRMITDMFSYVYEANIEHIILVAGSNELAYPMKALKRKGVQFTVMSTLNVWSEASDCYIKQTKVSPLLRQEADFFIDLFDLISKVSK